MTGKDVTHLAYWGSLALNASHETLSLTQHRACAKPHHIQPEALAVLHTRNQPVMGQMSEPRREGWTRHQQAWFQLHLTRSIRLVRRGVDLN